MNLKYIKNWFKKRKESTKYEPFHAGVDFSDTGIVQCCVRDDDGVYITTVPEPDPIRPSFEELIRERIIHTGTPLMEPILEENNRDFRRRLQLSRPDITDERDLTVLSDDYEYHYGERSGIPHPDLNWWETNNRRYHHDYIDRLPESEREFLGITIIHTPTIIHTRIERMRYMDGLEVYTHVHKLCMGTVFDIYYDPRLEFDIPQVSIVDIITYHGNVYLTNDPQHFTEYKTEGRIKIVEAFYGHAHVMVTGNDLFLSEVRTDEMRKQNDQFHQRVKQKIENDMKMAAWIPKDKIYKIDNRWVIQLTEQESYVLHCYHKRILPGQAHCNLKEYLSIFKYVEGPDRSIRTESDGFGVIGTHEFTVEYSTLYKNTFISKKGICFRSNLLHQVSVGRYFFRADIDAIQPSLYKITKIHFYERIDPSIARKYQDNIKALENLENYKKDPEKYLENYNSTGNPRVKTGEFDILL